MARSKPFSALPKVSGLERDNWLSQPGIRQTFYRMKAAYGAVIAENYLRLLSQPPKGVANPSRKLLKKETK